MGVDRFIELRALQRLPDAVVVVTGTVRGDR
jgi:hypothetical protein